jgi:hypothetical protein
VAQKLHALDVWVFLHFRWRLRSSFIGILETCAVNFE